MNLKIFICSIEQSIEDFSSIEYSFEQKLKNFRQNFFALRFCQSLFIDNYGKIFMHEWRLEQVDVYKNKVIITAAVNELFISESVKIENSHMKCVLVQKSVQKPSRCCRRDKALVANGEVGDSLEVRSV
jgi:hypothetical protein